MIAHSDLLAGCFGMQIDHDNVGLLLKLWQNPVDSVVGTISGLHEQSAYHRHDRYGRSFGALIEAKASAGGLSRKIRGPGNVPGLFQRSNDISFSVCVVA